MGKKILLVGVGSIGTYLALKLSAGGNDVTVLRSSKLNGIKTGDSIKINGAPFVVPNLVDELKDKDPTFYDYIFLTCKMYDIRNLLKEIIQKGLKFGTLISIQNSLFEDMWYFDYIKDKPFVIVSVYEGFFLDGRDIKKSDYKGWFVEDDMLGRDIHKLLLGSDIAVSLVSDIRKLRAEKTVINCALNAISAIEDKTFAEMIANRKIKQEMKTIFDESYDILSELVKMKAKRMLWQELLDRAKEMKHYSSTWQDVKQNRKTEIAFLNGYVVSLSRRLGKPASYNQIIMDKFRAKYPGLYYVQL
ncbi:MAG: ketopantoate reductase C-terminal domain-containing protein [Candidatus ainarchaeum sp.]|nr:ketopantoate reductase C-terminal domain-containing protein [Candidatus ainarchaeum sp.]